MAVSTKDGGKKIVGPFTTPYAVFVEGEVVVLNSGGPHMTVIDVIDDTDEVIVAFADGEGSVELLGFPSACVRKVVTN